MKRCKSSKQNGHQCNREAFIGNYCLVHYWQKRRKELSQEKIKRNDEAHSLLTSEMRFGVRRYFNRVANFKETKSNVPKSIVIQEGR